MKAEEVGGGDGDGTQSAFGGMLLCANPLVRAALSKLCRWAVAGCSRMRECSLSSASEPVSSQLPTSVSWRILCPFDAAKHRRMEFCNFFGISKLLFLLLQRASVAPSLRSSHQTPPERHQTLAPFCPGGFFSFAGSCCCSLCLSFTSHCWSAFLLRSATEAS